MKRFQCSLQRVLDVREAVVTRCEAKLAESERVLQARRREHETYTQEIRKATVAEGQTTAARPLIECKAGRAWLAHLADCVHRAGRAAEKEQVVVGARRADLQKAMMEHKVIENLSRRERYDWLERLRNAEQKDMDEAASQTHRKKQFTRAADDVHLNPVDAL
jgi:flagellar export protein FliJ